MPPRPGNPRPRAREPQPCRGTRVPRNLDLRRRTHRAPTTGKDAFGRPEPRDGPTGPRPTGKGSFGSLEPQRRTHQGPSAIGSRIASDPRAGGQTAQAARQRDRRQRRASSEVRRCLPDGALGRPPRARPSERSCLRARQTEEPTAQPPPGGKRVDGTGGPLGARRRAGRTGPKPLGAKAHQAMHRTPTRPASAGRRSARIPWPALCGPSGPRGAATRHSSERRREGIRTSLGPSPREYRAVCQWKRRQTRNGLRSGAKP
jgi:hypothetical protein